MENNITDNSLILTPKYRIRERQHPGKISQFMPEVEVMINGKGVDYWSALTIDHCTTDSFEKAIGLINLHKATNNQTSFDTIFHEIS